MDEATLRAMMPMSFGKKGSKKTPSKATPSQSQSQVHSVRSPVTEPAPIRDQDREASARLSLPRFLGTSKQSCSDASGNGERMLGKRRAVDDDEGEEDEEEEEDGLTVEERAANREAERKERERRARGVASSSSSTAESDSDSEDEIGPHPPDTRSLSARTRTRSPKPLAQDVVLPPMESSAMLDGTHTKTVSALAIDASGARFALGSYDYSVSFYDFGGMSSRLNPFRQFEPAGSYPLLDLDFSSNGNHVLVVSGTRMAKVVTRDGVQVEECSKGDPYLRDMRHTRGHVSSLTCGKFHPSQPTQFLTGASDSTVRLWDLNTMAREQTATIVLKSQTPGSGTRTKVTAIQPTHQSTVLASGLDGSLGLWDLRSTLNRPRASVKNAHLPDTWTSSIAVNPNGYMVATRGGDSSIKLWDLRGFRTPLVDKRGLHNTSPHTNIIFDPFNANSLLTCTGPLPCNSNPTCNNSTTGADASCSNLIVFDSTSLSTLQSYAVPSNQTGIRIAWSCNTHQLFLTTRQATLHIFYSHCSTKGILLPLSRPSTFSSNSNSTLKSTTFTQFPVEPSQSQAAKRRRLAKDRKDSIKTQIPQLPLTGPGKAGRIGAAPTQHIVQSIVQPPNPTQLLDDPRQALLKYATPTNPSSEQKR